MAKFLSWKLVPIFKAAFGLLLSLPQESLSEKIQSERLTVSEWLRQYGIYLGCWLLSTGLAFGCAASIYFLCQYEQQVGERSQRVASVDYLQPDANGSDDLSPFIASILINHKVNPNKSQRRRQALADSLFL